MTPERARSLVHQQVTNYLSYSEFQEIVKGVYEKDYSFCADEELGNDSAKSYGEITKEELDEFDHESLDEFTENGDYQYISSVLLQDLVNKDYLPEGSYVITVSY